MCTPGISSSTLPAYERANSTLRIQHRETKHIEGLVAFFDISSMPTHFLLPVCLYVWVAPSFCCFQVFIKCIMLLPHWHAFLLFTKAS